MEVYEYSTEAEARARTGRNPVGLKWIDTNRERRSSTLPFTSGVYGGAPQRGRTDLPGNTSAGDSTSPTQCCVSGRRFSSRRPFLVSIADVSRAHLYADAVRDVYVRLPDEDPKAKQPGVCGKLRKTMYGSLGAAQRWGEHYAHVWETGGFSRGVASPCHFFREDLKTYILVHGYDFFHSGST